MDDLTLFLCEDQFQMTLENEEKKEALDKALESINPMQKQVIIRMKVHNQSIKEVAAGLNLTESNVKVLAFRGYKALHHILSSSANFNICIFCSCIHDLTIKELQKWG